jgi:hypothetical protein
MGVATNNIMPIPNFMKIGLKVELNMDTDACKTKNCKIP